jgi:two-component sensor histidine kinase
MAGAAQQGWYNLPEKLDLAHDLNHLTFQFIGVYLPNPEKVRYKYMLVGFDSIWQPVTSIPEITYSNLPPGKYVFHVIASEDGVNWLSEAELSCPITIKAEPPPLWKQWWFMLGHILLLAGLIYFYNARRTKRMREQQEYLEQEVKERTQVIAKQNEEKTVMLMEIHHRVKNNLQTVSALLRLQSRRIEDPAASAALNEAVRRIASIALVHETLSSSTEASVAFDDVLDRLVTHALELSPRMGELNISRHGELGSLDPRIATPLSLVVTELIHNALEHGLAESGANLTIEVSRLEGSAEIVIFDDGVGLPDGFTILESANLGLQIVRTLTENELKGSIDLIRTNRGTEAKLNFPI